ncbi:Uncharacterized protein Rs2_30998 [Raphanus sativus]|nr:Uncharacterized protein Rs2_30998 [Raphanus sativus]
MRGTTVKVNCYHSGKFKTEDGKLIYANGEVEVLEVDGVSIFEDVVFQMVHKTELGEMWYKLPYEDLEDRKSLSANIDQGKKQLKTGGCWMKEVDFYIEKIGEDERINEEEVNVEQENVVLEVEERMIDQVANEEERIIEQGEHENETNIVNEEAGEHGFEEDGDDADYEESEEETSSDEEEEQAERMARAGLLDGVLSLRQTFSSGEEFKKQMGENKDWGSLQWKGLSLAYLLLRRETT